MSAKLLPCPFCGSTEVRFEYFCCLYVICEKCEASGGGSTKETRAQQESEAAALWNRRIVNDTALNQRVLEIAADLSDAAEGIRALATEPCA